jgi:ribonuclease-3
MKEQTIKAIETIIDYQFKNKALLVQAFTSQSYSRENQTSLNNEILELIGDKILDKVVIEFLVRRYTTQHEFGLSASITAKKLKEYEDKIVQSKSLVNAIDNLGLSQYLVMAEDEMKEKAQNQAKVKEYLFESLVGAVAIDCKYRWATLEDLIILLLNPKELVDSDFDELPENKLSELHDLISTRGLETPFYEYEQEGNDVSCTLTINNQTWKCKGSNKQRARISVSNIAYQDLIENKQTTEIKQPVVKKEPTITEEVETAQTVVSEEIAVVEEIVEEEPKVEVKPKEDKLTFDNSVKFLERLYQKGNFSEPYYEFKQFVNAGELAWKVEVHIPEIEQFFTSTGVLKKLAKQSAAFEMAKYVLDLQKAEQEKKD